MQQIIKRHKLALKSKLGAGKNPKLLVHAISQFHESTDQLINKRMDSGDVKFDCKKGCSMCCHLKVEIFPPESFRIANYVRSLPDVRAQEIIKKLRAQADYAKETYYTEYNRPCTFLSPEGACEIYSIRPHNCRAYLSKSVAACESSRDAIEDNMLKSAEERLKADMVDVYKSKKCDMHGAELALSTLMALENEHLQEEWANGSQVFPLVLERMSGK